MRKKLLFFMLFPYCLGICSSFVLISRLHQLSVTQGDRFAKHASQFNKYLEAHPLRSISLNAQGESCSEIFLESTDAFGIVYNANYVTLYQRALEENLILKKSPGQDFVVVEKIENMKFTRAAELGDILRVENCFKEVINISDEVDSVGTGIRIVCEQKCTRASDGEIINSATTYATLFNTDGDYKSVSPDLFVSACNFDENAASIDTKRQPKGRRVISEPIRVFSDELQMIGVDVNGNARHGIGLFSALRYFERSRTLHYGGPKELQKFTSEGIAVVVAKVDNLVLHHPHENNSAINVATGDTVVIENYLQSRGKSLITFHHRLYLNKGFTETQFSEALPNSLLIAECSVVLACLNATTGRAAAFPDWAHERT